MLHNNTPTQVLQITDLHLKADPTALWRGHNVQQSLDAVLQLASQHQHWPPQLILVSGDIVDDETPAGYRSTYARLAQQLRDQLGDAAATTKIGFIPGNHDDAAILEESCKSLNLEGCGAFRLNNWQIIQLDSSLPDCDDGELGNEQLALLDAALSAPQADNSLIVLHHPLAKLGSAWMDSMRVKDAQSLFTRVDKFNSNHQQQVRAIIWGHAHQEANLRHQQVSMFGTPAAGPVQFTAGSDDFAIDTALSAGFRWLTLHDDGHIDSLVFRL